MVQCSFNQTVSAMRSMLKTQLAINHKGWRLDPQLLLYVEVSLNRTLNPKIASKEWMERTFKLILTKVSEFNVKHQ